MPRTPRPVRFRLGQPETLPTLLPELADELHGRTDDGVSLALLVPAGRQLVVLCDQALVREFPNLIPLAAPHPSWTLPELVALVGRGEGEFEITAAGEQFALVRIARMRSLARVRILAPADAYRRAA